MTGTAIGKRKRRWVLVALAVAASAAIAVAASASEVVGGETPFQTSLRATVDKANKEPRVNPANVRQTSLAEAASGKHGPGTRTNKLAKDAVFRKIQRPPNLPNVKDTGIVSGGCLVDYGTPGVQCLPAHSRGGGPLTCAYVLSIFPHGVPVTGRDRFHLDSNGDQIACGPGDNGVP